MPASRPSNTPPADAVHAVDPDAVQQVRGFLLDHGFTTDGLAQRFGAEPVADVDRDRPDALHALLSDDAPSALATLLLLGGSLSDDVVRRLRIPSDALTTLGLARPGPEGLAPGFGLRPLVRIDDAGGERVAWLACDHRTGGPLRDDHVLGPGGAATTLAGLTPRRPVRTALDLGTGSGIQLLHLAGHADRCVGTDLSPRALAAAAVTLALSGVTADLRRGDRYRPVAGERFDLIVSNPPMVIGPSTRHRYRDGGLMADALCGGLVARATEHLAEDGSAHLLAHWLHVEGQDWRERVGSWLPLDADAWVIQREVLDPVSYVRMWLVDSGEAGTPAGDAVAERWLAWFADQRVEAVGMGWIAVRRSDPPRTVRLEHLAQAVQQPLGDRLAATMRAWDLGRGFDDAALADARVRPGPGVVLEAPADGTSGDGAPSLLAQTQGLRLRAPLDAVGAAVIGSFDGSRTVREALVRAAEGLGLPSGTLLSEGPLEAVRGLIQAGFLEPVPARAAARTAPPV